jgi:hypothetical protein
LVPQALNPSLLASPQARRAPLSFLPDVFVFLFLLINPLLISMSFPWVITDFIYFYAPTVIKMYPSNSLVDGSAIDSFLPILSVLITAFRAIVQCGELQTLVPAMPEECASPMCTLLFPCMLLQFSSARFFFKPPLLLFVFLLLVAFLFLLTLALVKENACSHPGLFRMRGASLWTCSTVT